MTARHVVDRSEAEAFLRLPRLAVIGASADPKKFGNTVYKALRDRPEGHVVPVNRTATTIEGDTCYPTIASVPDGVDGAVVMLPAEPALAAVRECLEAGVSAVWLFRGIGSGTGALSDAAVAACRDAGVTVIAGACPFMFLEPVSGMHRLHRSVRHLRGAIAA